MHSPQPAPALGSGRRPVAQCPRSLLLENSAHAQGRGPRSCVTALLRRHPSAGSQGPPGPAVCCLGGLPRPLWGTGPHSGSQEEAGQSGLLYFWKLFPVERQGRVTRTRDGGAGPPMLASHVAWQPLACRLPPPCPQPSPNALQGQHLSQEASAGGGIFFQM